MFDRTDELTASSAAAETKIEHIFKQHQSPIFHIGSCEHYFRNLFIAISLTLHHSLL